MGYFILLAHNLDIWGIWLTFFGPSRYWSVQKIGQLIICSLHLCLTSTKSVTWITVDLICLLCIFYILNTYISHKITYLHNTTYIHLVLATKHAVLSYLSCIFLMGGLTLLSFDMKTELQRWSRPITTTIPTYLYTYS